MQNIRARCPYLWDAAQVAEALKEAMDEEGAGVAGELPEGIDGKRLLLLLLEEGEGEGEGELSDEDRNKVDAMLTRVALTFMLDHATLPEPAPAPTPTLPEMESPELAMSAAEQAEANAVAAFKGGGKLKSLAGWRKEIAHAFIRPARATYATEDLGGKRVLIGDMTVTRVDFELEGSGGKLQCSHWEPEAAGENEPAPLPCIVYLHGNCGSRMEALEVLQPAMIVEGGASVCCFDFAGCGLSDGEYISLGWWETRDLDVVLRYLAAMPRVSSTAVWGRSMGAVTALLYASTKPPRRVVAAMVLDSPFSDLKLLAKELVTEYTGRNPPKLAIAAVLSAIGDRVWRNGGFFIDEHRPVLYAGRCSTPVRMVAADDDTFVAAHHAQAILAAYGGEQKELVTTSGDHNSERPADVVKDSAQFLATHLAKIAEEEAAAADGGGEGGSTVEERKVYEEQIASAEELVEKWRSAERVAFGTSKGKEAREKRLEAEEVRTEARAGMAKLGGTEKWLVEGTVWIAGRSHGARPRERPRTAAAGGPGAKQAPGGAHHCYACLACLACLVGVAVVVVGIIIGKNWYLGYFDDAVVLTTEGVLVLVPCLDDDDGCKLLAPAGQWNSCDGYCVPTS